MGWLLRSKILILILIGSIANKIYAHPVSYKGSVSFMSWTQPYLTDIWTTYSFRPDMAVAARYMKMNMPEGNFQTELAQYDVLLKRWNKPNYQANIYAYGGYGAVRFNDLNGTTGIAGLEADAESRKYYISGKSEWMRPSVGPNFDHYELRLGVAAYEAEFNEIASWLILQYQYHPSLAKPSVLTPLARFFYKNVLWETGASLDGDIMINLMFHF